MTNPDLIYDVGLHRGEDTAFYLAKGFRVVAFEANPHLAAECRERFRPAIAANRLTIVEGAIVNPGSDAAKRGVVQFYRNLSLSIWGTTDPAWMRRNAMLGAPSEIIEVPAVDFGVALETHGIPYYLKIDIEGADNCCLYALHSFQERPEFLSLESEKVSFSRLQDEVRLLTELGYSRFCAVQQADVHLAREPEPPREGIWSGHKFHTGASGLFGHELPGPWITAGSLEDLYEQIFLGYRLFGDTSLVRRTTFGRRLLRLAERLARRPLPGWYDTHAWTGSTPSLQRSTNECRNSLPGPREPSTDDQHR